MDHTTTRVAFSSHLRTIRNSIYVTLCLLVQMSIMYEGVTSENGLIFYN